MNNKDVLLLLWRWYIFSSLLLPERKRDGAVVWWRRSGAFSGEVPSPRVQIQPSFPEECVCLGLCGLVHRLWPSHKHPVNAESHVWRNAASSRHLVVLIVNYRHQIESSKEWYVVVVIHLRWLLLAEKAVVSTETSDQMGDLCGPTLTKGPSCDLLCHYVNSINASPRNIGKEGKFQLLVCLGIRWAQWINSRLLWKEFVIHTHKLLHNVHCFIQFLTLILHFSVLLHVCFPFFESSHFRKD